MFAPFENISVAAELTALGAAAGVSVAGVTVAGVTVAAGTLDTDPA